MGDIVRPVGHGAHDRIGHAVLSADLGQRRAFHLHRLQARQALAQVGHGRGGVDELVAAGHHTTCRRGAATPKRASTPSGTRWRGQRRRKSSAALRSAAVSAASAGNSARASSGTFVAWEQRTGVQVVLEGAVCHDDIAHAHLRPHAAGQPREHDLVDAELANQRDRGGGRCHLAHARRAPAPRTARGACRRSSPACRWCARWRASSRCRMAAISPSTSSWSAARMPRVMAARIDEKGASIPAPGARRKPGAAFSEPSIGTGRPLFFFFARQCACVRFPSHSSPGEFRWNSLLEPPPSPLSDRRIAQQALADWRAQDRLDAEDLAPPWARTLPARADRHRWLERALLMLGTALLCAGVVVFFAFNWDALHKFTKFGLLAGLLDRPCVRWRHGGRPGTASGRPRWLARRWCPGSGWP